MNRVQQINENKPMQVYYCEISEHWGTKKILHSPGKTNTKLSELEWLQTSIPALKAGGKWRNAFKILRRVTFQVRILNIGKI